jgi:hypothetical protein
MMSKESHPFIVNTLESNCLWTLCINQGLDGGWWASFEYDRDQEGEESFGDTLPDALDRLEATLAGREG